jgi:protocatechuate 3,4-dioxygenase beta subunit
MQRQRWLAGLVVVALVTVLVWQLLPEDGDDDRARGDGARVLQHAPERGPPSAPGQVPGLPPAQPQSLAPASAPDAQAAAHAALPDPARADLLGSVGAAVHVTARIVDATGSPLLGARACWLPSGPTLAAAGLPQAPWENSSMIMYAHYETRLPEPGLAVLPQARADAEGRVALDTRHVPLANENTVLSKGGMPRPALLVTHDGWTTRTLQVKDLEGGARDLGDIALEPEAIATGRAVDESGRPLAGIRVRLWSQRIEPKTLGKLEGARLLFVPELMQQLTGDDGRFTLRGLWQGDAEVELKAPDRVRQQLELQPRSGETLDLGDVAVPQGAFVAGRVLDADGAPIAGAKVSVADGEIHGGFVFDMGYSYADGDDSLPDELEQAEDNYRRDSVLTDASGAFRVGGLDSPALSVYATADGFEPGRLRPVAAGSTTLRLALTREALLHVTVIDRATRAPLPGAVVRVVRKSLHGPGANLDLRVEADGAGAFVAHRAGFQLNQVIASAPGYAELKVDGPGVEAPQSRSLVVELLREAVLAGHVHDAQGAAVAGARVSLHPPGKRRTTLLEVTTDADGAFRMERLSALTAELVADGKGKACSPPLAVTLADGERREGLELRLPAPARIHGTVYAADGTPVTKGTVKLELAPFGQDWRVQFESRPASFVPFVRVDGQGRYAFEALGPGEYQVSVHPAGPVTCTLAEGEERLLDFRAPPGVRVRGRVTAGGEPVAGAPVKVDQVSADGGPSLGWMDPVLTDAEGAYVLQLATGGHLEVYVDPRGGCESARHTVHANPGDEVVADIALTGSHIAGRAVDHATGAPMQGLEVTLCRDGNVYVTSTQTAEDGSFRLSWLPADTYQFRVSGNGKQATGWAYGPIVLEQEPRDIPVAEGAAIDELVLSLCRGATLEGEVRLADGSPVKDGIGVQLVRLDRGQVVPGKSRLMASGGAHGDDSVLLESEQPIWHDTRTEGGRYRVVALPAGEYRVLAGEATADEVRDLGQPVVVREHDTASLDLVAR